MIHDVMSLEFWEPIPGFPNYMVSNFGRIFNSKHNKIMRISQTQHGNTKISLIAEDGTRHDRSVAKLVGEAFVVPPNARCDQIVPLDGNVANVEAQNLVWRPSWYAWKYLRQLRDPAVPHYFTNLPVLNMITGVEYESIVEAGMAEGLLFEDIWRSTYTGDTIFPYGTFYQIIRRV
jgi:NUMOD4 motif